MPCRHAVERSGTNAPPGRGNATPLQRRKLRSASLRDGLRPHLTPLSRRGEGQSRRQRRSVASPRAAPLIVCEALKARQPTAPSAAAVELGQGQRNFTPRFTPRLSWPYTADFTASFTADFVPNERFREARRDRCREPRARRYGPWQLQGHSSVPSPAMWTRPVGDWPASKASPAGRSAIPL